MPIGALIGLLVVAAFLVWGLVILLRKPVATERLPYHDGDGTPGGPGSVDNPGD